VRNVVIALIALVVVAIGITALFSRPITPESQPDPNASQPAPPPKPPEPPEARAKDYDQYRTGAVHATLVIAGRGTLGIEMYPAAAPKTVAHITALCKRHFYDGQLFHRYIEGFVIQTGDPASKSVKPSDIAGLPPEEVGTRFRLGIGGSGETVPLEAKLSNLPGTLGLAHAVRPDSGDSQFFINLGDNGRLDSDFCAFGRVVSGIEIVPRLRQGDRIVSFSVP
jgi:cyclophilin family peptidyl-prolyl cis-trans isomerase